MNSDQKNNVIIYTASSNIHLNKDAFDVSIVSHIFKDGVGIITIPNSVTSIGSGAFEECYGLTSITIPNSVTSIGDWAFDQCSCLTSITIPNSVTRIGDGAFSGCSNLTSITIPNSVTSIGDYAFSGCSRLASIIIPNSVTSIGDYAFYNCSGLTSINIPDGVTSIGNYAFNNLKRKVVPTKTDDGKIKGYKGMWIKNGVMSCRDFIYEVGKIYKTNDISCCERGFHFCTNILDVFNYYFGIYGNNFIICEVEGSEEFDFDPLSNDTKICTSTLKVISELSQKEVIDTINNLVKQPN